MRAGAAPLVLITSIPRRIETPLPDPMPNATVNQQLAGLVARAGGIPVAADAWAPAEVLLERVDAVVINAGLDLHPSAYGAERHLKTEPAQAERDEFELGLARSALDRGLPVIGICRGMHVLNVACGGSLIQHLPDVTDLDHHDRNLYACPVHDIEPTRGSRVAAALGTGAVGVNSIHHQGIDRLGAGLAVTARAPDGIVEAIEDRHRGLLGIQWHPEFLAPEHVDPHVAMFEIGDQSRRARRPDARLHP